jgi:hypothetical protein
MKVVEQAIIHKHDGLQHIISVASLHLYLKQHLLMTIADGFLRHLWNVI